MVFPRNPYARLAVEVAAFQAEQIEELKAAGDKIIEQQNRVLAQAHAALTLAFERMTIHHWADIGALKQIASALCAIEGRRDE